MIWCPYGMLALQVANNLLCNSLGFSFFVCVCVSLMISMTLMTFPLCCILHSVVKDIHICLTYNLVYVWVLHV